ncbi:DinB family protein [Pseudochryseolinea flava]|uniref:DinB family protein n=1 Tax=Pseudochryseolinea flava TaxID=2059302 RepID=A0A364YCB3_9BACT|nr:DinB family protein [Pseudochryseolinea flava]RAW03358.1 DinB family protein [Pseudochryseolinea flava]
MTAQDRIKNLKVEIDETIAFVAAINAQDETLLNWKQSAERWSILECIEHLNRYCRYYNVAINNVLTRSNDGQPVNKSSWLGKKFISMMHPSNRKMQKTMKHLNPVHSKLSIATLHEFLAHQDKLLHMLDASASKSIGKQNISVEFLRILTIPFFDAFEFLVVHQQRHILQIRDILEKRSNREAVLKV